ncbi:heavy metal translocating P-type ATPase [Corallincola platygyrae]|uniref:Heavy metal translocating P-type ATPase n=1 Tax=Corallincola platygyrae TaxID=1193278 RepID=A0ABW4XJH5_9GAMM
MGNCYHCGEEIPAHENRKVMIDGQSRAMCCAGCEAVAQSIVDAGLSNFYRYRTEQSDKIEPPTKEQLNELLAYDLPEVQQEFVAEHETYHEAVLTVEGIRCAACAWLIEHQLGALEGVVRVTVNTTTHRLVLQWQPDALPLSDILTHIQTIGYKAVPFQPGVEEADYKKQFQKYLIRLGIAGLATMQVMMFAVGLYFGVFSDLDEEFRDLLRWTSMIMATPVILYSSLPFYRNAIIGLRAKHLNMDLPVSIALLLAYSSSAYATLTGTGEVYFESVSMFAFFLLLGRFLEMRARRRASEIGSNLLKLLPAKANLVSNVGSIELVAASSLKANDKIRIVPGDTVPADAKVIEGESRFDESMLTGESYPVSKRLDGVIYAGTVNREQVVVAEVLRDRNHSVLSDIVRLQAAALDQKPKVAIIADKIARWFIPVLLIIAALTYTTWLSIDANEAFWITLSVLVATCPCALSLATPTAITCAYANLSQLGLMIRRGHVLEALAKTTHVVFDKTGTLTHGKQQVTEFRCYRRDDIERAKQIAHSLEAGQHHPIAKAISRYCKEQPILPATDHQTIVGQGVSAVIDGQRWYLGRQKWLDDLGIKSSDLYYGSNAVLANDTIAIASFDVGDALRSDVSSLLGKFKKLDIQATVLTGDDSESHYLTLLSAGLKRDNYHGGQLPEDKLSHLKSLQAKGHKCIALGDGINDAPLLAAADCSVAMGSGTDLAKVSADTVLPSNKLSVLLAALELAKRTASITKQNLGWALAYNLFIIPLAVSGYIAPYFAALGMSLSSLLVVSNSMRLLKTK